MKDGVHRAIDWDSFEAVRFNPFFFNAAGGGCGGNALGLLTGIDPLDLPHRDDWTPGYMCRKLREHGFRVHELSIKNLTAHRPSIYMPETVTASHVVLARIKICKPEATWVVLYDGRMHHNFEVTPIRSYSMLNTPLMNAYIVHHHSWNSRAALKRRRK